VGLSTADITSFPRERLVGEYWPLMDIADYAPYTSA
jgi:hypothetical protein